MSLRTPLGRVLNHGAAHQGVGHWVAQRVAGLALAPLSLWLLISLLALPDLQYASVTHWLASGWTPVLLPLLLLLALWHSWLGVQVVVEDYVHGFLTKTATLLLSACVHALLAAGGLYAVLHVALRSP